ncbi:MAG: arginine--tRNA ligase [Oscillospiraceae bacterium]|nr:arginine--tRNA ligase [Oscillospiraceae bacterium]
MNLIKSAREQLASLVKDAYDCAVADGVLPPGAPEPAVEIPKDKSHGDFSTAFAMQAARALGKNPRETAAAVLERLLPRLDGSCFASAETLGAGFINVRLSERWYSEVLGAVADMGDGYGSADIGKGRRVMVEFVSANPTGPMTIGNARGGVLGDSLASVLQKAGYDVSREFYLNDAGNQVDVFARSLEARYIQHHRGEDAAPFPEDGYHGDYVRELAADFAAGEAPGSTMLEAPADERRAALTAFALPLMVSRMKDDLARYGVRFDRWFRESGLHESGYVDETIGLLTRRGHTYEKDGALWFRATDFGCEKDDVLRKANGFYTYYAADIAYHRDKFAERGYDICVDIFGADHHGHTLRFKAGMEALGLDPERLRFVLMQLVRLTRGGEAVRMSKRTGKAITLGDLLDEIPLDAARFFFNNRSACSHLEFDMALAVRQDSENPVYYVQYAHARITNMLNLLKSEGLISQTAAAKADASLLPHELERALIRQLALFPETVAQCAAALDPSGINTYLVELANCFHRFYNAVRLKGAEAPLLEARAALCACVRDVLRGGLTLLGISAPEKM